MALTVFSFFFLFNHTTGNILSHLGAENFRSTPHVNVYTQTLHALLQIMSITSDPLGL